MGTLIRRMVKAWALLGLLALVAMPPALAACSTQRVSRQNHDSSVLTLTTRTCEQAGFRHLEVTFAPQAGQPARSVGRDKQVLDDAPTGGGEIVDWDGDGENEIAVNGMCAGPNCDIQILRVQRPGWRLQQVFRGWGDLPTHRGKWLLQSGRDGCCADYVHVYPLSATRDGVVASAKPQFSMLEQRSESDPPTGAVHCVFPRDGRQPGQEDPQPVRYRVPAARADRLAYCVALGRTRGHLPPAGTPVGRAQKADPTFMHGWQGLIARPDTFGIAARGLPRQIRQNCCTSDLRPPDEWRGRYRSKVEVDPYPKTRAFDS